MTQEEALAKLRKLKESDNEHAWVMADKIVIQFLCDAGFKDIADAWQAIYANP